MKTYFRLYAPSLNTILQPIQDAPHFPYDRRAKFHTNLLKLQEWIKKEQIKASHYVLAHGYGLKYRELTRPSSLADEWVVLP